MLFYDTTATLIDNDDDDDDVSVTETLPVIKPSFRSPLPFVRMTNMNCTDSLSEIAIFIDHTTSDNEEETFNNMIIDTPQDSEEEIDYLINDNNIIITDFLDQINIYELQTDDATKLESP